MRRRAGVIAPRRRTFVGCEGESEQGFGRLLQRLCDVRELHVHIDAVLASAGDPLAIFESACRQMHDRERKHGQYEVRGLLLDADKLGQAPARDARLAPLAAAEGIRLVWQRPCHEALLLRHLPGCQRLQPATTSDALAALLRHWPNYAKPMAAANLGTRIGQAEVQTACAVETELRAFLAEIGFLP